MSNGILVQAARPNLKTVLLATVSAMVAGAVPAVALAQQASSPPASDSTVTEVVITGYRRSLSEARTIKRDSTIQVDAIVADDIAKFPELNLAESLQRLPGVQITREAGEGRRISLRGLGPDYSRVQLNGMEVLGNVDSAQDSRGQRSRDRAFDFNIFASELFSKAEVEKTFQASQNEGGMAGTVGLFTGKPLDYDAGFKAALTAKLGTNEYTKDTQPRIVGLLSRNWDNKFGVAVSIAYAKRETTEQGHNDYNYSEVKGSDFQSLIGKGLDISHLSSAMQAKLTDPNQTFYFADGNRMSSWNAKLERLGLTGAMQWRPMEKMLLTLDVLHSEFTTHRDELHLATRPLNGKGSTILDGAKGSPWPAQFQAATVLNKLVLDANNYATYTDASNVTFGSEHRRELNHNRFNQAVVTGKWQVNDRLSLDGHAGAEKSLYNTPYDDKLYMRAKGAQIVNWGDGRSANFSYPGTNLTDPSIYAMDNFYYRSFNNSSSLQEGVLNGHYKLTEEVTLRAGVAYHSFTQDGANYFYDSNVNGTTAVTRGTSVADITTVYSNSFGSWLIGDYAKAFAKYKEYHRMGPKPDGTGGALQDIEQVFKVTEKTKSEYVQADWDTHLLGKRFRGNIGLRAYQTDTHSTGRLQHDDGMGNSYAYTGTADVKGSYDGVLPAMNSVVELTPEVLVRFAATENLNRPSLGALAAKGNAGISDSGQVFASIGNPNLKPFKDDTLDLAVEYYFGKVGLLSASVFHKKITNFISNQEIFDKVTLAQVGLGGSISGLPGSTVIHDFSQYINVKGSHSLTGIELAAQTQFFFLPAPYNNLGFVGNVTHVDAPEVFTGISKNSANATLYYETARYGARVSMNYRSRYYDSHGSGAVSADTQGYEAQTYVDAAAFWNVTPKLQLTFDAVNLTNEKNTEFFGQARYLYNQTQSGATYMVGIAYKY